MSGRVVQAKPEHEAAYQDMAAIIGRYANAMSAEEILAVAANMVGKLMAMQDQRTMTRERALEIVIKNIETGNAQAIEQVMRSKGSA